MDNLAIGVGLFLGSGVTGGASLPNRDELIYYTRGVSGFVGTSTYLTSRYPSGANHTVPQEKGVSVLGDGTGFGLVAGILTTDTISVGTGSGVPTITIDGRLDIANGVDVWGLQIHRGEVLIADLNMMCGTTDTHPTVELSATPGLPNCEWSNFAGPIYQEHTDGSGFDVNVLGWNTGLTDGVELWDDPTSVDSPWTDNSDGSYIIDGTGTGGEQVNRSATCTIGDEYEFVFEISEYISGTVHGKAGSTYAVGKSGNGLYREAAVCSDFGAGSVVADAGFEGTVSGISVQKLPVGRQPANYQGVTDNQGPISPDMKVVGIPCLLGDGTGYAAITGLLTTDVITVPDDSSQPTNTVNGRMDFVSGEKPFWITVTRASVEWAFYPCEAGEGTFLEDIIGGNNGTLTDFAGDPWSTRDDGRCTHVENGFSIDKNGVGTGISCANDDGLHQDSTVPTYPRNTMSNALNAEVLLEGALGPKTQSVALWTAEAQVDLSALPANTADQTFVGDDGTVVYDTAQSADDIDNIVKVIGELT